MEKRKKVWKLRLSIIISCVTFIMWGVAIYGFVKNNLTLGLVVTIYSIPLITASWWLNLAYREENKGNAGVLSLIFFILSIGGAVVFYVVGGVLWLLRKLYIELVVNGTPSSPGIEIKDENGDKHTLKHTSGRNYKDEDGNWWTQDYFDSSKFTRD